MRSLPLAPLVGSATPPITSNTNVDTDVNISYRQWIVGQAHELEGLPFWLNRGVSLNDAEIIAGNFVRVNTSILEGQMTQNNHVGQIISGIMLEMPNGWIPMSGNSVLRTAYPELAMVVPLDWLNPTHIIIPNMQLRGLVGKGTLPPLATFELGTVGGEATHTLGIEQIPSHNHAPLSGVNFLSTVPVGTGGATLAAGTTLISVATTGVRGGGQHHNNMSPFLAVNYFIFGGV